MNIVGMTTTAAAKNSLLIQRLKSKIVIAEEAAEVQEIVNKLNFRIIGDIYSKLKKHLTPESYSVGQFFRGTSAGSI